MGEVQLEISQHLADYEIYTENDVTQALSTLIEVKGLREGGEIKREGLWRGGEEKKGKETGKDRHQSHQALVECQSEPCMSSCL